MGYLYNRYAIETDVPKLVNELDRLLNNFEYDIKKRGLSENLVEDFVYDLKQFKNKLANIDEYLEDALERAYEEGKEDAYDDGRDEGYDEGYAEGYEDAKRELMKEMMIQDKINIEEPTHGIWIRWNPVCERFGRIPDLKDGMRGIAIGKLEIIWWRRDGNNV